MMRTERLIGTMLILGALGVLMPYTILTVTFNYPDILRLESGDILTKFHEGGSSLIFIWLAFALLGIPILIAYSLIGQLLETKLPHIRWVTSFGIISVVVQIIGLLRWVFVVPVLASDFVNSNSPARKEAIEITFIAIHQFGGVLLGEHLGQLFTVIWTIFISSALLKVAIIPGWLAWWGYISSFIYLLAQVELLATVISSIPVFELAGLLGSTLWLIWLILVGLRFIRHNNTIPKYK